MLRWIVRPFQGRNIYCHGRRVAAFGLTLRYIVRPLRGLLLRGLGFRLVDQRRDLTELGRRLAGEIAGVVDAELAHADSSLVITSLCIVHPGCFSLVFS
jgi:hypothetical protein